MSEVAVQYVSIVPKFSSDFGASIKGQVTAASKDLKVAPPDAAVKAQAVKTGKSFGDSFKAVAGPMLALAGVGAISQMVSKAVGDFSELEDATAAAGVVFGDSMSKIEAAADGAASALGISKVEATNAAITFGTFGKSAGLAGDDLAGFSTQMVQLAGDMASFRGTSPEQAIEAIGSAMRGESEPIRAYGVLLDDATLRARAMKLGLIDTVKDGLTPQNKVLAAQAEILAQTTDAQGDFARTSESTANTQKLLAAESANLSAEIGEKLAPAIVAAQRAGIGMIQWATDNQAALVPLVGTMATLAAGTAGIIGVGKALEGLKAARAVVQGLGDAFMGLSTKSRIAVASAGALGLAIAAAGAVYSLFAQRQAVAQQAVEDYTQALEADNGALDENVRKMVAKRLEDAGGLAAAQRLGIGLSEVTDAVLNGGSAMEKVTGTIAAQSDKMGEQTAESVRLGEAARILTGLLGGENAELIAAVEAEKRKAAATSETTTTTTTAMTATEAATAAMQSYKDSIDKVYLAQLTLSGSQMGVEAAIDAATESIKKNGKTLDIGTDKGRANRSALDDIARAGLGVAKSMSDAGASNDEVAGQMDKSRKAFIDAATQMGLSKTKAKELATSLGLIKGKKVKVNVEWGTPAPLKVKVTGASGDRISMVRAASGAKIPGVAVGYHDDKVPALLTPEEWVIQRRATRYYGDRIMANINAGRIPREMLAGFDHGGRVGGSIGSGVGGSTADLAEALRDVFAGGLRAEFGSMNALSDTVAGRIILAMERG